MITQTHLSIIVVYYRCLVLTGRDGFQPIFDILAYFCISFFSSEIEREWVNSRICDMLVSHLLPSTFSNQKMGWGGGGGGELRLLRLNQMLCAIWYHLENLQNMKKKAAMEDCYSRFLKLYKWYQIVQCTQQRTSLLRGRFPPLNSIKSISAKYKLLWI